MPVMMSFEGRSCCPLLFWPGRMSWLSPDMLSRPAIDKSSAGVPMCVEGLTSPSIQTFSSSPGGLKRLLLLHRTAWQCLLLCLLVGFSKLWPWQL